MATPPSPARCLLPDIHRRQFALRSPVLRPINFAQSSNVTSLTTPIDRQSSNRWLGTGRAGHRATGRECTMLLWNSVSCRPAKETGTKNISWRKTMAEDFPWICNSFEYNSKLKIYVKLFLVCFVLSHIYLKVDSWPYRHPDHTAAAAILESGSSHYFAQCCLFTDWPQNGGIFDATELKSFRPINLALK